MVDHSSPTLNFSISCDTAADSIGESWGFRDIEINSFLCHDSCSSCNGTTENQCLSCNSSLGYYFYNNSCISLCPSGFYGNNDSSICEICDILCKECFGPSSYDCLSCQSFNLYQNACIEQCPNNTYLSYDFSLLSSICLDCNNTCQTCSGPLETECLTCFDKNYYFLNNECLVCHETCMNCHGTSSYDCDSCNITTGLFLYNSQCINQCPSRYFYDSSIKTCNLCDSSCLSCNDSSSNDCLKCQPNLLLTLDNACQDSCDLGSYAMNGACEACYEKCLECSGPTENDCNSCKSQFYLFNSLCYQKEQIQVNCFEFENPVSFGIFFNETIFNYFNNLFALINVFIYNYDSANYDVNLRVSSDNMSVIIVSITYNKNFTGVDHLLMITINSFPNETIDVFPYYLAPQNNTFQLNDYNICDDGYYLNEGIIKDFNIF